MSKPADKKPRAGRAARYGVAALVLFVVGWIVYRLLFPVNLADSAQGVAEDLFSGNTRGLYKDTYDEEIKYLGWTPQKVNDFYYKLLGPRFARARSIRYQQKWVNTSYGTPTQGVVDVYLKGPLGNEVEAVVFVNKTDEGPKTSLVHLLRQAWRVDYYFDHPDAPVTVWNNYLARKAGYEKDKAELLAIGVPGLFDEHNPSDIFTWPEFERDLRSFAEKNGPSGPNSMQEPSISGT